MGRYIGLSRHIGSRGNCHARSRTGMFLLLVLLGGSTSLSAAPAPTAVDPESLRTLAPALEARLKEWFAAWRVVKPGLGVEQFKKDRTETIGQPWHPLTMDVSQKHPGFPLFVFSPDGHLFLDVLGGLVMSKKDGYVQAVFQPDSWVYLVDRKTSKLRQILVVGTGGGFHEALWLSNDIFMVAGYSETMPEQNCSAGHTYVPIIHLVNLLHDSVSVYRGPASCEGVKGEYMIQKIKQKIPNVRF